MIEITDANLQSEILDADKLAILDFGATWCQPCKKLDPIMKELAGELEGQAVIGHCDVAKAPEAAKRYGVMSVPTVIFFKGGNDVDRFVGLQSKEQIIGKIQSHL
jgi:thioredoxin 1